MDSSKDFLLPLDLPDWNQGIKALFTSPEMHAKDSQIPEKKPAQNKPMGASRRVLATNQAQTPRAHQQKVVRDQHGVQAEGLSKLPTAMDAEFWLQKAATLEPNEAEQVLMEALQRDVKPVTSIARALHELHKQAEASPAPLGISSLAIAAAAADPPASAPRPPSASRALTPTRTGLTGRALRVPSRLAKTPGAAGAEGNAPPPTKFKGILKKLQFSAVPIEVTAPVYDPATTTKRLHFEGVQATPLGTCAPSTIGYKSSLRRVTFGADTASPAHTRPRKPYTATFQTPEAIFEGESGEESDGDAAGSTVNSRNAGATPFDRRLSALFAKYSDGESGDGEVEATEKEEQETPDLWKRLSAVPAAESIKGLAQTLDEVAARGSPEAMSLAGNTPISVVNSPLYAPNASGASPAGVQAIESQQAEQEAEVTPNTSIASILGVLLRRSLEDIQASKEAEASAEKRYLLSGAVSPTTGVLSVLPTAAPLSRPFASRGPTRDQQEEEEEVSDDDMSIESPESSNGDGADDDAVEGNVSMGMLTPVLDAGAASDIDLSPIPASVTASEASFLSSSTPLLCLDGVLRDAQRVPLVTPGTVTLFRGGMAPIRSDGIAADLYRSFTTPETPYEADEDQEDNEEYTPVAGVDTPREEEQHQANAAMLGEEGASFGFSFQPALALPRLPTSAAAAASGRSSMSGSEGTPDFQPKSGNAKTGRLSRQGMPHLSPTPASQQMQQQQGLTPVAAGSSLSLGKPQRVVPSSNPSMAATPPPSLTKEVRGLMQDMQLRSGPPQVPAPGPAVVSLSPARASPGQKRDLGVSTVVTPVRRSPRFSTAGAAASKNIAGMLEASGFAYAPNPALNTTENAIFKANGTTEKKKPCDRKSAAADTPTLTPGAAASNNSGVTPATRYSLRSASKTLTGRKPSPGSADKALKLSPTEQNIRNTLRRSSRRKSTLGPAN